VKTIRFILFIVAILCALAQLGSVIAPYFSPRDFWPMAFLGLAFPFLFVVNCLFGLYYGFSKSKRVFVPIIAVVSTFLHVPAFLQLHAIDLPKNPNGKVLNVMSFNTHYMGAYDYNGGDSNFFFNMLDTLDPDIICLQEFANLGGNYEKPMFKKFFNQYEKFYRVNADALSNSFPTGYGVCIFSKYPVVNKGFLELENQNSNLTVFADILVGTDTIRVVNTHLKSIVFDKEDYKTVEEIKAVDDNIEPYQLRKIVAKLKYAFQYRARQAEKIREKLNACQYPIILCGDFNDSPTSYSYNIIRGKLKDSFMESAKGMSRTYIGKMPSFRIDYILHDPRWKSYNYKTNTLNFSDHKMVSCSIVVP